MSSENLQKFALSNQEQETILRGKFLLKITKAGKLGAMRLAFAGK
jgi:hypothetical protein